MLAINQIELSIFLQFLSFFFFKVSKLVFGIAYLGVSKFQLIQFYIMQIPETENVKLIGKRSYLVDRVEEVEISAALKMIGPYSAPRHNGLNCHLFTKPIGPLLI